MRDEQPARDGATADSKSSPKEGGGSAVVGSSKKPAAQASGAFGLLKDAAGPEFRPTSAVEDPASSSFPSTDDALQAAGDVAAAQRRFFDLRRALKSAVRVLTKERSFLPNGPLDSNAPYGPVLEHAGQSAAQAEAPERPIGLSGHTSSVAMPEVLGFLAQLRKSGTLWIWNELEQFCVQLVDGNVTFARSEARREGSLLGEILIAQGAVDAARFEAFMKQERAPGPLGDALIAAGLVTRAALSTAVQHQAQCVFNRAYALEDAYFSFDANDDREGTQDIRISVTQMLFESARERDETEQRLARILADPLE